MKNRWIAFLCLSLMILSVTALAIQAPAGQVGQPAQAGGRGGGGRGAAAAPACPVPRGADGKPDLSGAWLNGYNANTIRYEATVEDPIAFTGPMKLTETCAEIPWRIGKPWSSPV